MQEQDGFRIEAAEQFGCVFNEDCSECTFTEAQLIAFAKACERKGIAQAAKMAREVAAKYDPQNSQENALAGELVSIASSYEALVAMIDAEIAPNLVAVRQSTCKHDGTHSFGCNRGVTKCDKCGKMFGVYNIDLERIA